MDTIMQDSQGPRKASVTVLVPARNQAKNLQHVLPKIPAFVDEVIVIDGHSSDDTIAVAQSLLPNVRILEQVGRGKGDAIRLGLEEAKGDIIVLMDADGFCRATRPRVGGKRLANVIPTAASVSVAGGSCRRSSSSGKATTDLWPCVAL